MTALQLDRTIRSQNVFVAMSTLAAIFLLALVLAHWTWVVLAPSPVPPAQVAAQQSAVLIAAPALFGLASAQDASAAPTTLAVTLLGTVVATPDRRGHALVRLGEQASFVVREGESMAPGITLIEVGADQVVLERAGLRETLAWPRPRATSQLPGVTP